MQSYFVLRRELMEAAVSILCLNTENEYNSILVSLQTTTNIIIKWQLSVELIVIDWLMYYYINITQRDGSYQTENEISHSDYVRI
jgi:hypothetical protein